MLFDSHTHLDSEKFDNDREEVITRAIESGISLMMNPGADLASSMAAVELAARHPQIYAAVGVHPHDVKNMDESMLMMIRHLAAKPKVKAIGEIGLDFHYDFSPRDLQMKWFIEQLKLAKLLGLPVIIHDREANEEVFRILKEEEAFSHGVLMHCFSGSHELAKAYVKHGAMISIAGPVTYQNNKKTVQVVETIGLEHLLIETDSPYLTPVPHRGKRNEPCHVKHTCERIAQIKGVSFEEVAMATYDNAKRFFRI